MVWAYVPATAGMPMIHAYIPVCVRAVFLCVCVCVCVVTWDVLCMLHYTALWGTKACKDAKMNFEEETR